jgi:hypothetical protein
VYEKVMVLGRGKLFYETNIYGNFPKWKFSFSAPISLSSPPNLSLSVITAGFLQLEL